MRKKVLFSAAAIGLIAALSIPLIGFGTTTAYAKVKPNQVTLESGGVGVPIGIGPFDPKIYHEPTDGIISGALGCVPDTHEFDKSNTGIGPGGVEHEHIVFTAGVTEISEQGEAVESKGDFTLYVEITSNGQKLIELPFRLHDTPDPNTGKPFWVSALYFEGNVQGDGRTAINLPTGEYNYKFKAKEIGKNGHVLDVWVPKNHKFTIVDSADKK
ncbi:hypothetical protein GC093_29905 [Paenibacillus sp. LMG 31456]|uniref:Uncharacterized protein n=1 Tax=Paenibacillus foliorum TaxID=2654974 RepID=A0A972H083_9BACL|nr:hypothetical protein [Paenibacillus foliorum]NOU97413.1 hypothetical protein [Paenibacillus foliorum]